MDTLDKNYISQKSKVFKNVKLEAPVKLYGAARVGHNSSIGKFSYIESRTTIFPRTSIGRYCSIGKDCQIGVIAHPVDWLSTSPFQYNMAYHFPDYAKKFPPKDFERPMQTTIGNDVWIGANVLVKRGVVIGDGAIVGAGAVVTKDIPPYAIVGGVPAKIIRYRFDKEVIKKLLELKWWDLPHESLSGITFENIQKSIKELEEIVKSFQTKRCWIYRKNQTKRIACQELEKYLAQGWNRGRKQKETIK